MMITTDDIANEIRKIGLDPIAESGDNSVCVVYEMTQVVCYFDPEDMTVTLAITSEVDISGKDREHELNVIQELNQYATIGKCFLLNDQYIMIVYQARLWNRDILADIIRDGLKCISAMSDMYIRLMVDFSFK